MKGITLGNSTKAPPQKAKNNGVEKMSGHQYVQCRSCTISSCGASRAPQLTSEQSPCVSWSAESCMPKSAQVNTQVALAPLDSTRSVLYFRLSPKIFRRCSGVVELQRTPRQKVSCTPCSNSVQPKIVCCRGPTAEGRKRRCNTIKWKKSAIDEPQSKFAGCTGCRGLVQKAGPLIGNGPEL